MSTPQIWTGRRRLYTALTCGVPDRVPINTYEMAGRDSRDWYNLQPSYRRLMDAVREKTDVITNWNPQPANDRYIGADGFLGSSYAVPTDTRTEEAEGAIRTETIVHTPRGDLRCVTQKDPAVNTTWFVEHFCKSVADVDKALSVPYKPALYDDADYPRVVAELGDHGLVMASLGDPAYLSADLMSFEDYMLWALEEKEHFARTVEVVAERVMENLRRQLRCRVVDAYRICGPEYMTPPYAPPAMFGRFMLPHVRTMTDIIHGAGAKVRLHCHGRIGRVLDMILDTGCDGLDPCEPPPDGDIELGEVKRRAFARGVSVWGNMELKMIERGTPEAVRAEVRRIMDQAKEGGGFALIPTASPVNAPLAPRTEENLLAFIDAGLEFGKY
jgi:hypothetical protein